MPINTRHPVYRARIKQWTKIRDFYNGEDAVKDRGEAYLPKLKGQTPDDYKAYKMRAMFFSIIAKSVGSMVGLVTSTQPRFTGAEETIVNLKKDVPIVYDELIQRLMVEMSLTTKVGVLVDYHGEAPVNEWPTLTFYRAEDIINWGTRSDGSPFVVLMETHYHNDPDTMDEYDITEETRYRVLTMGEIEGDNGITRRVYIQKVYDNNMENEEVIVPVVRGSYLDYIPFVPLSAFGLDMEDSKPLMLDVANVNHSHYLTGADLEHGRHFTGLPTPVILNAESDRKIFLGSTEALVIPGRNADAKFLEYTGQGLTSLEKALADKERQMISLSAKALQESGNGSESAEAIMLRFTSESASLRSIVNVIEKAINLIYRIKCQFMGIEEVSVELDKTFVNDRMDPDDALKWYDLYLRGGISVETLVHNYKVGKVYPDDYRVSKAIEDVNPGANENSANTGGEGEE